MGVCFRAVNVGRPRAAFHDRRCVDEERCVGWLRQERLAAMSVRNPWVGGVVRPATPADAAPIAACHNTCWRETFGD